MSGSFAPWAGELSHHLEPTMQRFIARESFTWPNGAIGWRPGGPFDCIGPFAKVQQCPVEGQQRRYTCYAQGYADTFFSIPAATRIRGQRIHGFLTMRNDGPEFIPTRIA
jgi:hypothetical protein